MASEFNLRSYLTKLSTEAKEATVQRLREYGELTDEDVRAIMENEIIKNLPRYKDLIEKDDLLRFVCLLFSNYPDYLARALVQLRPEIFYNAGITSRIVAGLRAEIGSVILPPSRKGGIYELPIYRKELPEHVQQDLFLLYRECRFRDYLYYMSRNPHVGFEAIAQEIKETKSSFERRVLQHLRDYCKHLFAMKFPDFISEIKGKLFPAFHVRWWIDQAETIERVLNIGATSTYKTSFAVVGMHTYGCRKVLFVCPAHARVQCAEKIASYFREPLGKVLLITGKDDIGLAKRSRAQYTVVAYSTLIQETSRGAVSDQLLEIPFDGLVLDESQYMNHAHGPNPAQRAQACERLIGNLSMRRFMALAATPWENDPSELGPIVSAIMPDVIPSAEAFRRWGLRDERFLREFLSGHVIGADLRDISDLPPITPTPWEDPFGAELIEPTPEHAQLYRFVQEDESVELTPIEKVSRLLLAVTHPHKLANSYKWPASWKKRFTSWELSTKLAWLKEHIAQALKQEEKVVVGSGIYADGVTRSSDNDEEVLWVGRLLKQWFGDEHVLILDGQISASVDSNGSSKRDRLIQRWQSDPKARILLISMRACPDSVQMCVKKAPGVKGLFLTTISFGWKPWEQFRSRFYREEQEVPIRYRVPILKGTIDENLLRLNRQKLQSWESFHARSPIAAEYLLQLTPKSDIRQLVQQHRSPSEQVRRIAGQVSGKGEKAIQQMLQESYGVSTYGEVFARAFLETQEFSASGHISRCMEAAVRELEKHEPSYSGGQILDAGCGPLTLERRLQRPVYGIDMNPHMVELGVAHSSHKGLNAQVGFLSKLPSQWTGKFRLTACSLVLHWSSIEGKTSERLAILSELVRVAHPYGRIWIACADSTMNEEIHDRWVEALRSLDFIIVEELTGLIRAKDVEDPKRRFQFWSVCFSPDGKKFPLKSPFGYAFLQEEKQKKYIQGGSRDKRQSWEEHHTLHNVFEVVKFSGEKLSIAQAAQLAAQKARVRLEKQPWRVLQRLYRMGIIKSS